MFEVVYLLSCLICILDGNEFGCVGFVLVDIEGLAFGLLRELVLRCRCSRSFAGIAYV